MSEISEILAWLESREGEAWSRAFHKPIPVIIISLKSDDVYTSYEYSGFVAA